MTRDQLISTFRNLADDNAQPYLWSDAVLTSYAAHGELEACRRARLIEDRDTAAVCEIAVVAGTHTYAIDQRVIYIRRARLASQSEPLGKASVAALDEHRPGWEDEAQGAPLCWAPVGNRKVRLVPTPAANDTLRLTVVRGPLQEISGLGYGAALGVASVVSSANVATLTLNTPPATALAAGQRYRIAGATQTEYNGIVDVVSAPTTASFTYAHAGTPDSPATGTITAEPVIEAVQPEILPAYHMGLVRWMLHRAFLHRERQDTYRPEESARYLAEFEAEFGAAPSAIDETWILRKHGYDEYEGLF